MKNFLLFTLFLISSTAYSQIRIIFKSNRIVTASRVEFSKNAVFMDEYHKINSRVYEVDKSVIKSIIDSDGKVYDFSSLISSKEDIEDFKRTYNENKPTIVDSTKKEYIIKQPINKEVSEDSINALIKSYIGLPEKDKNVFIEEVFTLKEADKKDAIYLAVMEWVSKTFKSSKAVIDFQDKDAGKIICKGFAESPATKGFMGSDILLIDFSMNFSIKDGKYRVQIYNLSAKEKHYESTGMAVLRGLSSSPNVSSNDTFPIDINKINHEYVNNITEGKMRNKYAQKVVIRTYIVLKSLTESAKEYIEKSIKEQDKDF